MVTSESDNGWPEYKKAVLWPLTRGSGKRSAPIARKGMNQRIDLLPPRAAAFEGSLLLPSLIHRLALFIVDQFDRHSWLRRWHFARAMLSQTMDQVVRAAVVVPAVSAAEDVNVGRHVHGIGSARTMPRVKGWRLDDLEKRISAIDRKLWPLTRRRLAKRANCCAIAGFAHSGESRAGVSWPAWSSWA